MRSLNRVSSAKIYTCERGVCVFVNAPSIRYRSECISTIHILTEYTTIPYNLVEPLLRLCVVHEMLSPFFLRFFLFCIMNVHLAGGVMVSWFTANCVIVDDTAASRSVFHFIFMSPQIHGSKNDKMELYHLKFVF